MAGTQSAPDHCVFVGDFICLFNEELHGFVYSDDTSVKNNGLKVFNSQLRESRLPNVHAVTYQLLTANRYKLTRRYKKLCEALSGENGDSNSAALAQAKAAAEAEAKDNEAEQNRLLGHPIRYGDVVQLHHTFTNKFVSMTTKEASKIDNSKMQVLLQEDNAKQTQFRIQPRYKVKTEGELVELEDVVLLESVKSPGSFLHVSVKVMSRHKKISEINCGSDYSVFHVYRHYTPNRHTDDRIIRGGSVIQPFHKHIEGYFSAEGLYGETPIENPHLRFRPMDPQREETFVPPRNANTLWQVVLEESAIAGDMVVWETTFHIQHMSSRHYLTFLEDGTATLVKESSDDTLFQFQPLLHDTDSPHVCFEATVRIYHIATKGWVHCSQDQVYQRGTGSGAEGTLEAIQWDRCLLLELCVSADKKYQDAFVIKAADMDSTRSFNYIVGLFPFLRDVLQKTSEEELDYLPGKDVMKIMETFEELKYFISHGPRGSAITRKNMARQTKITDLMVDILRIPVKATHGTVLDMYRKIYEVFLLITRSRTNINLLYCGRFLPFFQTQMLLPKSVGVESCSTVIELIRDNRKVLDRVQPHQITHFIQLLTKHGQHQFLDLLGTLCICNGIAITANQTLIAETLLRDNKSKIYQLESGKGKLTQLNRIFISTDNGRNWDLLEVFSDKSREEYNEDQNMHLVKQLELYKKLCYGGNETACELVTKSPGVFRWEVILRALEAKTLSPELKSKICDVLIGTYLEAGKQPSILEQMTNNFVYRHIQDDLETQSSSSVEKNFPGLKTWIIKFLKDNAKLVESNPERNILVSQVIRIVSGLVKFGYVTESSDLEYFKAQMVNFIRDNKSTMDQVTDSSTITDKGILDTKIECTTFIDIMLSLQFKRRMEHLLAVFKQLVEEPDSTLCCIPLGRPAMTALMSAKTTTKHMWSDQKLSAEMKDFFDVLQRKADYFGHEITNTLFMLSNIGSDVLRRKAFHLLNTFFTSTEHFIATAARAKLLLSKESEQIHIESINLVPTLRRFSNSKITEEDLVPVCNILSHLQHMCQLEDNERNNTRQNILVNNGVLEILFKLILQDSDKGLKIVHTITETVTRRGLEVLLALARGNEYVQTWIHGKLDDLLYGVSSSGPLCAAVLIQVFEDAASLCRKIKPKQIQQIVTLTSRYKEDAAEFLHLLTILTKDSDSQISSNQLEIMKSLMAKFSTVAFPITKPEEIRVEMLKGEDGNTKRDYFVNLVDLVAACAKGGKNAYIESACQKFLQVPEILRVLVNDSIDLRYRLPFAKFFIHVYLKTTRSTIESGTASLSHDRVMWDLIEMLVTITSKSSEWKKTMELTSEEYTFMVEAGFYIIQSFFGKLYEVEMSEYPEEQHRLMQLETNMEDYCSAIAEHITKLSLIELMSDCLQLLRTYIGTTPKQEKLFEKTRVKKALDKARTRLASGKDKGPLEPVYRDEEVALNQKFFQFCSHLHEFVLGQNNVVYQTNTGKGVARLKLKEYMSSDDDNPLPRGLDFQKFVNFFNERNPYDQGKQYQKVRQVIQQLHVSCKLWGKKASVEQESLDLRCMQILRALLYNKIVLLPDTWDDSGELGRVLEEIKELQGALDNHGVVAKVMPLMSRDNPEFGKQVLLLMDLLLFNANLRIQTSVYNYFLGTKQESFFFFTREAMDKAQPGIKQKRYIDTAKGVASATKKKDNGVHDLTKDLDILLRVLGGLCDGQNKEMQGYFRYQPDNLKTVNLVAKVTEFLGLVYSGLNANTIDLCAQLFATLHEMSEGNQENQLTMINYKIVDYINLILRKTDFSTCTADQVIDLRTCMGAVLYSMIEVYGADGSPALNVCNTLSVEHVQYIMTLSYVVSTYNMAVSVFTEGQGIEELTLLCSKPRFDSIRISKENREKLSDLGFFYYQILATMYDIDPKLRKKAGLKELEKQAFQHYKKMGMSVELLQEDKLQKKHFKVANVNLVREEIKETVKWGVDRSSPTSKLRDLLMYTRDILKDIDYQKRLHSHRGLIEVAKKWTVWNYSCILISLAINILMVATWSAPLTLADIDDPSNISRADYNALRETKPEVLHITETQYYILLYTFGAVHCVCSVMLFSCYILLYHPTMPDWQYVKDLFTFGYNPKKKDESKLEIHFISTTTLYYLVLVLFSILGNVYYGYFFAFHLFGIVDNNQLLKGVIKAVTLNGKSLVWVGILGVVILYIYTLVAFSSFRPILDIEEEIFCSTLARCFVTLIRYGTIGDMGEKMHLHENDLHFKTFGFASLFHVTFFIVFTTILLNIIFGIIVDTFSQIRDTKWIAEKDMKDFCFICSRENHDFEHHSKGFRQHVKEEHNLWAYVFYLIYLHEREDKDYTALDMHVNKLFKATSTDFFPLNRALSLTKPPEYTVEDQIGDVMKTLADMQHQNHLQEKALANLTYKLVQIEKYQQDQATLGEDGSAPGTPGGTLQTEAVKARLSSQAEQWRRAQRVAETTRRMSTLSIPISDLAHLEDYAAAQLQMAAAALAEDKPPEEVPLSRKGSEVRFQETVEVLEEERPLTQGEIIREEEEARDGYESEDEDPLSKEDDNIQEDDDIQDDTDPDDN